MSAVLNPYISFQDQAAEAMDFYRSVLGGELTVMRFSDMGGMGMPEAEQGLVMHSQLVAPVGTLMAADTPSHMTYENATGFSVSLSGGPAEEQTLRGYWEGLAEGASIDAPLEKAPWGDVFGMLRDRYGVQWMFNIGQS